MGQNQNLRKEIFSKMMIKILKIKIAGLIKIIPPINFKKKLNN